MFTNKKSLFVFFLSLCFGFSSLTLAKTDRSLFEVLNKVNSTLELNLSAKECHQKIEYFWQKLYELDAQTVGFFDVSAKQIDYYIQSSFEVRLKIKEKLKKLRMNTDDEKKCLRSIKRAFTALRYVEDYLIEYRYQKLASNSQEDIQTLTGEGGHFLINPRFKGEFESWQDLKGGDVLLSRGNAFSSAAIARVGKTDTQFSHLSLVHQKQGALYTSEAHIEIGNVVAPIEVHLNQKNARTVVFRHQDSRLAAKAGEVAFNHIEKFQQRGRNIEYDFGMDYHDEKRLFCSEVIYYGYRHASLELGMKEVLIPKFKTTFEPSLLPFLQALGINVNRQTVKTFNTFGPGDIQFDDRFEMIAEWRNPKKLQDSRFKDAILTKLFDWMEQKQYEFDAPLLTGLISRFSLLARKSDFVTELLKSKFLLGTDLAKKFPRNMTVSQMKLFLVLDEVGEYFYQKLKKKEHNYGAPLSLAQMFNYLEELRVEDKKLWDHYQRRYRGSRLGRTIKKPAFHLLFHP
ncbi:MAG: YiiX/YebB-like N1pC/P60 family cysteine hydrolase [Bacteriovoracaceae bacterium]|jgi:hypothetical protein|nr:YiiX/YebB-like N1pC/P60 family cysteine hydrolase [Bacteriovoracaceae bacterium]